MATIYTLNYRLSLQEARINHLYCYLKLNPGGGEGTLQSVTDAGSETTNPITSTNTITGNAIGINTYGTGVSNIFSNSDGQPYSYTLPAKSGNIALLSDIPTPPTTTMQMAYNNGNTISNLINASGDPTFIKDLVVKSDGTIGWDDRYPLTKILGNLDLTNTPPGMNIPGTVFKKADVYTIQVREAYIPAGTARQDYMILGDISSAYGIKVPFEIMFPTMVRLIDTSSNATYYPGVGILSQRQLIIILPPQALNTALSVSISTYFQFTNTNPS